MTLDETGNEIMRLMRKPASPLDPPGDRLDAGVIRRFGADAVEELVRSGLLQRGGTRCPIPEDVAVLYPEHMKEHAITTKNLKQRGESEFCSSNHILFVTQMGWDYRVPDVPLARRESEEMTDPSLGSQMGTEHKGSSSMENAGG